MAALVRDVFSDFLQRKIKKIPLTITATLQPLKPQKQKSTYFDSFNVLKMFDVCLTKLKKVSWSIVI
jgi:hypothetical protein